jgi:hypothetical protein
VRRGQLCDLGEYRLAEVPPDHGGDAEHVLLALGLLRQRGADAAPALRSALDRAEALLRETGARNYQPFVHLERAELARLSGDPADARRERATAERLFRAMGAPARADVLARDLA